MGRHSLAILADRPEVGPCRGPAGEGLGFGESGCALIAFPTWEWAGAALMETPLGGQAGRDPPRRATMAGTDLRAVRRGQATISGKRSIPPRRSNAGTGESGDAGGWDGCGGVWANSEIETPATLPPPDRPEVGPCRHVPKISSGALPLNPGGWVFRAIDVGSWHPVGHSGASSLAPPLARLWSLAGFMIHSVPCLLLRLTSGQAESEEVDVGVGRVAVAAVRAARVVRVEVPAPATDDAVGAGSSTPRIGL